MADDCKLNQEDLKNITGGVLDNDAQGFYDRNLDALRNQSVFALLGLDEMLLGETTYTLEQLKTKLVSLGYNLNGMT